MNIIYNNSQINNKRENQKLIPSDQNIIIKQKSKTQTQKIIPSDQNIIIKQKSKHITKHKPIDELKFQQDYLNYINLRNAKIENRINKKLERKQKEFNYNNEYDKFTDAMMYENKDNKLNSDDINKIKFISFSKFKRRLLISELEELTNIDFFFSKNKEEIRDVINNIYEKDKKTTILSPIIENSKSNSSQSPKKTGGSSLTDMGKKFLSILSELDKKHDFVMKVSDPITHYINNTGKSVINSIYTDPINNTLFNNLFASNKDYEEDIMINFINNTIGTANNSVYFNNIKSFSSFAFIDIADVGTKLEIFHKSPFNKDTDVQINQAIADDIYDKLKDYINKFYKFNPTSFNNYKYLLDIDLKLNKRFKNYTHFHHNLYNKIGNQLYPFENAYDPHPSNKIDISITDRDDFIKITNTNFNYNKAQIPDFNENDYAVKEIVNKYLSFNVIQAQGTIYHPCINLKLYDKNKLTNNGYLHSAIMDARKNIGPALYNNSIISTDANVGVAVLFNYPPLNAVGTNYHYIKYTCQSFNTIPILSTVLTELIQILNSTSPPTTHDKMKVYLNKNLDTFKVPGEVIAHHIVAYLYYCNDKTINPYNNVNCNRALQDVISILFDLKKSGDWGQALFCSQYNKNNPTKDCFFVSGDRLASIRSMLCNNVKTVLPVEYKIISGVASIKKHSILTLYRNKNTLTFEDFHTFIEDNIFTLEAFKELSQILTPHFYMKRIAGVFPPNNTIITMDNFCLDNYKILLIYLQNQMAIFLHLYSIINLHNGSISNIDHYIENPIITDAKNKFIQHINYIKSNKTIHPPNINPRDYDLQHQEYIYKMSNYAEEDYNKYNLKYFSSLPIYRLLEYYNNYITYVNNTAAIAQVLIETLYEKNYFQSTYLIYDNNPNKKVIELFINDYNKIIIFDNIISIDIVQQNIINMGELYETYSLLVCDDKYIDLNNSIIPNPAVDALYSKTAIKRIIDNNNNKISNFISTFTDIYRNKSAFKEITRDIITTKLADLYQEMTDYQIIDANLNIISQYIINPNDVIVYLKDEIRADADFLQSFNTNLHLYFTNNPLLDFRNAANHAQMTPDIIELKTDYEYYENSTYSDITYKLYSFYSSFVLNDLLLGFNPAATAQPLIKEEIIKALNNLYADDNIKIICEPRKTVIYYFELHKKLSHKIRSTNRKIQLITENLNTLYTTSQISNNILFRYNPQAHNGSPDGSPDGSPVGSPVVAPVIAPVVVPVASVGGPVVALINDKKRKNETVQPIRKTRNQGAVISHIFGPDEADENFRLRRIRELFHKLSKQGTQGFHFTKETFKYDFSSTSFLKFLAPEGSEITSTTRTDERILEDIGFIIYILNKFNQLINDRTDAMIKKMSFIFNGENELITLIKKKKYSYYYDAEYIKTPLIYKYLEFIIKNKEDYLFHKRAGVLNFQDIYGEKYKHDIDKILYNMDIIFNITKNIQI